MHVPREVAPVVFKYFPAEHGEQTELPVVVRGAVSKSDTCGEAIRKRENINSNNKSINKGTFAYLT